MVDIVKTYPDKYSWFPDRGDPRDNYLQASHHVPVRIDPNTVIDLSGKFDIPIWNQDPFGSCTLFSSVFTDIFCAMVAGREALKNPAFLMPYYNMRAIEKSGSTNDAGGTLRNALKALKLWGVCDEKFWPYDKAHFALKPDEHAQKDGAKHKVEEYLRVNQSLNEMVYCLMQGYPFVFGFSVPQSFEDETGFTGILKMPKASETMLGGHAIACVGVDYPKRVFKIRNSWSPLWGDRGYFSMPFDFALDDDLCDDFWTTRKAS